MRGAEGGLRRGALALALAVALVATPARREPDGEPAGTTAGAETGAAPAPRAAGRELVLGSAAWEPRSGSSFTRLGRGAGGVGGPVLAAELGFAAAAVPVDVPVDVPALGPREELELWATVGAGTVGVLWVARADSAPELALRVEGGATPATGAARGPVSTLGPVPGPALLHVELLWVGAGPPAPRLEAVSLRVVPEVR